MGDVGSARYKPALHPPMPDLKGFKGTRGAPNKYVNTDVKFAVQQVLYMGVFVEFGQSHP